MSGPSYVELKGEAAKAVQRYEENTATRRTHESASRKLKREISDDLKLVRETLGDADFGQLPDGRIVHVKQNERNVSASEARVDTWSELVISPAKG